MEIGHLNTMPVWIIDDPWVLLGDRHHHALLPAHELPAGTQPGDRLRVFVYRTGPDQVLATLKRPAGVLGELVPLAVVDANDHGVFFAWGLDKDLFCPWKMQYERLRPGDRAVVHISLDPHTGRLIGSTKLVDVLDDRTSGLWAGQEVSLMPYGVNEVGVLVLVDRRFAGIVYRDELSGTPPMGVERRGYVARVRDDGKLDCTLRPVGRQGQLHAADVILEALRESDGFLPLTDKSTPEAIHRRLGLTKKAFKKGLGTLYRDRRVALHDDGVKLVS
ncbi:MAG: GntR family transcriptional regulator [Deltaproteobacteria bacterium]|nr:GntR family transcriptional regulator [Deltaproteobacteria bacterium]